MSRKERLTKRLEALREEIEKKRIKNEDSFIIPDDEEWETMKSAMRNGDENDRELVRYFDLSDKADEYRKTLENEHVTLAEYLPFQEFVSAKLRAEKKNQTPYFARISLLNVILDDLEFESTTEERLAVLSDLLSDYDADTPPSVPT